MTNEVFDSPQYTATKADLDKYLTGFKVNPYVSPDVYVKLARALAPEMVTMLDGFRASSVSIAQSDEDKITLAIAIEYMTLASAFVHKGISTKDSAATARYYAEALHCYGRAIDTLTACFHSYAKSMVARVKKIVDKELEQNG